VAGGIEEAKALFESRRKIEHAIHIVVMARATTEQLDALEKPTDEEKHIHHHGDEKSKTVLSGNH
jgi:DNA-binding GntR family transcriptional regulator